jgi:hypothetical protein
MAVCGLQSIVWATNASLVHRFGGQIGANNSSCVYCGFGTEFQIPPNRISPTITNLAHWLIHSRLSMIGYSWMKMCAIAKPLSHRQPIKSRGVVYGSWTLNLSTSGNSHQIGNIIYNLFFGESPTE